MPLDGKEIMEGAGFEPSVPRDTTKVSGPAHVACAGLPYNGNTAGMRADSAGTPGTFRGTDGSNPAPSSGESVSRRKPLWYVENPGFPRGWRTAADDRRRIDMVPDPSWADW
jgi:hypothetical protein